MTVLRIFLSYEATDATFATQLITDLRTAGAEVTTESAGLDDTAFEEFLSKELPQCQYLIVVQTSEALQSPRVQAVVDSALKQVQAGQMKEVLRVIAPTLKGVQAQAVPPTWANTPEFDATQDYPRALARLCLHLGIGYYDDQDVPPPPASLIPPLGVRASKGTGDKPPVAAPFYVQRPIAEDRPIRSHRYPHVQFRWRLFFPLLAMSLLLIVAGVAGFIFAGKSTPTPTPTPTHTATHATTPTPTPTHTATPTSTPTLGWSAPVASTTPSPIGYWSFDEGSGSRALDTSGNNNTGQIKGATWTSGRRGHALRFNGSNNTVDINKSVVNTSASFTVAAWVQISDLNTWHTAVSQEGNNVSGFYLQYMTPSAGGEFAFSMDTPDSTSGTTIVHAFSPFTPSINTWYHLVGVYDSSNNQIRLYVNGVQQNIQKVSGSWNATGETVIGRAKWGGPADYWSGLIDEVRIYNRALSATDVTNLYQLV